MNCLELFGNFEIIPLKMVNSRTNPTPSAILILEFSHRNYPAKSKSEQLMK